MKQIINIFLVVMVFAVNFTVIAQPTRSSVPVKSAEKTVPLEILDQANDFSTKGLPESFIIGAKRSDETAAKIARELSKYDEKSLPLLMAALQKTGFYIIDENQKILYQPTADQKGMGLAFYDYEVVGMLKLSRGGIITSVGKLADIIGKDLDAPLKQNIGAMMLKDLRTAANLNPANRADGLKRFWARLIIELGKQFPQPVDLMTATPENAQLNIIQASLWQRRLVGDLIGFAKQQGGINSPDKKNLADLFKSKRNEFDFLNASYQKPFAPQDPCSYADEETTEMDGAANVFTTIHGSILGIFIKASGEATKEGYLTRLEKVGKGLGWTSAMLNWAKLVAALSQVQGTIKVEEPLPLIRTKSSSVPGEKRLLTAKFEIKVNNLRVLNCYRTTINMTTGLDFNMPTPGPLAEKSVAWELGGEVSFAGQKSSETGKFDQVVYLLALDGANRDYHTQETDANGESKIYLEGNKQRKDINNQKVVPVRRSAVVRADIALKNMKDSKQEVVDISGAAMGVAAGGGLLAIFGALPEIGFRMKIPVTAVKIPVRDWTPCSEDWGGTISVRHEFKKTEVIRANRLSNGNSSGDGIRRLSLENEVEVYLNPRTPEELKAGKSPNPALLVMRGKSSDISEINRILDPCCGKNEGNFYTKYREGTEMHYDHTTRQLVTVGVTSTERDYALSIDIGTGIFLVPARHFREVLETNCILEDEPFSEELETNFQMNYKLPPGRYPERFVNSEGELLQGTKEINFPDRSKFTWSWSLARCQD